MKQSALFTFLLLASACIIPAAEAAVEDHHFAAAISESELEENSGMSGFNPVILNSAELNASNTGNTITTNAPTGSNFISDNAFQDSSGIVNIIQNSGNGVVIQNSTIVNLNLQ